MRLDERYPGAVEGHDDPDSVFYRGTDGPIEVDGRIYDDRNPYNISCHNPSCRAAGDCYCVEYDEPVKEGSDPPWWKIEFSVVNEGKTFKSVVNAYSYKSLYATLTLREAVEQCRAKGTEAWAVVSKYAIYRNRSVLLSRVRY